MGFLETYSRSFENVHSAASTSAPNAGDAVAHHGDAVADAMVSSSRWLMTKGRIIVITRP